jgi:hypothetical protein
VPDSLMAVLATWGSWSMEKWSPETFNTWFSTTKLSDPKNQEIFRGYMRYEMDFMI